MAGIQVANLYSLISVQGAGQSVRDLQAVSNQANKTQGSLGKLTANGRQVGGGILEVGKGIVKVSAIAAAAAVGLGVAAEKVGMDYQDAFAGVRKTVEGTSAELNALYAGLKGLATRTPISFTDLAGIAQEAGALGVPTKDVVKFTDVVARLSAATVGLTADAAAEAFGKLGNVLHQHGPDYERMGSALVALGNAGASSEGDIVEVAKRFGAAGAQAKLSAAQVLGFSSAIASLGVEPEAAGSSLSRLFNNITKYIGTGNAKIKEFAKVSGVSVKQFTDLYAKDAAGAVELFLQRLGKLDRFKAAAALKAAGIVNIRDINAVELLSQNYGELKRQVDLSTDAYQKNTDLQSVSEKRFDTLKNHLAELVNTGMNAADTFSQGLSPALDRLSKQAATFVAGHDADFANLGRQAGTMVDKLGAFIDKIDWRQVEDGGNTFLGIMKTVGGIIAQIPPQVDAIVVSFLALNKVSGGLVGQGLGDILGGTVKGVVNVGSTLARSILSRIPKIGGAAAGALGALTAIPVQVQNWPAGFGTGGGSGIVSDVETAVTTAIGLTLPETIAAVLGAIGVANLLTGPPDQSRVRGAGDSGPGPAYRQSIYDYYRQQRQAGGVDLGSQVAAHGMSEIADAAGTGLAGLVRSLVQQATSLARIAANTSELVAEQKAAHERAKIGVGGPGHKGLHDFLLAFRTGGAKVAIKDFGRELAYLSTASDAVKRGATYQRGVRLDIAALQRAEVGATSAQKAKLASEIAALRRLLHGDLANLKGAEASARAAMAAAMAPKPVTIALDGQKLGHALIPYTATSADRRA